MVESERKLTILGQWESPLPASYNSYNTNGPATQGDSQKPRPLLIGITGGTASGKTSLCERIEQAFKHQIALVGLDMFYKGLS